MNIELTDEEGQALVELLDAANKAGGLQLARACLHFFDKLQAAAKAPEPEEMEID